MAMQETTDSTMTDQMSADVLMKHVRALAEEIGPRPAGSADETRAREYIRGVLRDIGLTEIEEMRVSTPNSPGYYTIPPVLLALAGGVIGRFGRVGRLIGGAAAITGAVSSCWFEGMRKPLWSLPLPQQQSANLLVRIPPSGEVRRRIVLIGHTDTSKHRFSFSPIMKKLLYPFATALNMAMLLYGLVHLGRAIGPRHGFKSKYWKTTAFLLGSVGLMIAEERGAFVHGANDNATAVACLLALGAHLKENPLEQTEVWLAFTGAEEVGCLGMHALLDSHGHELQDAWFIDFETVGAGHLSYVTRHSGSSWPNGYAPDPHSLALADKVAEQHPDLRVSGRPLMIMEEVGVLRQRGYRGICLAGVGDDGFLVNWHQDNDTVDNIDPPTLERAAKFGWAMLQSIDTGKLT